MELGTISILVQLMLIFVVVVVFAGLRRLRIRREQRDVMPGAAPSSSPPWPAVRTMSPSLPLASAKVPDTRFSLADWSAPTDRVALDTTVDPASLDWALEARVDLPRAPCPAAARAGGAPMSCTIAPQERQCA